MSSNRSKGTGTIEKRGERFRARYVAPDGSRPSKTFARQRDAAGWLRKELARIDDGLWTADTKMSLRDWLDQYIQTYKPHVAAQTQQSYRYSINRLERFAESLMDMNVVDVRQPDVQEAVNAIREELHSRTVQITLTLLNMALGKAHELGIIPKNPCKGVRVQPSEESFGGSYINDSNMKRLMTFARHSDDPLALMFWVIARTGCRTQEARALRASDVTPEGIHIRQSLDQKGNPKRVKSNQVRFVPIADPDLMTRLNEKAKLGGLLFRTSNDTPYDHKNIIRSLRRVLPDHSPHDIRHTFCTNFVRAGLPLAYLSKITGDKIDTLMKYYTHVQPKDISAAIRTLFGADLGHEANEPNKT